ncbi:MAG: hypothetical protein UV08_C0023G0007 [Parcubacteria group bacterium GW2011_GWA2_42_18]|nr:MAG: hypothetical protein UV08_C0023G0007 [Parcubacteria group bacterium GW2011_GWA2_42_18]
MANKNLPPTTYHLQPKAGFAMLFSVLISSLLVVIGLSIFNITLKELTISTASRESQTAFYAANSGMECALYWDLRGNELRSAFASTSVLAEITSAKSVPAFCNIVRINETTSSATTNFEFKINDPNDSNGPCANVTVTKTPNSPESGKMTTKIESQGKNICGTSGRRVERGLRASITTDM